MHGLLSCQLTPVFLPIYDDQGMLVCLPVRQHTFGKQSLILGKEIQPRGSCPISWLIDLVDRLKRRKSKRGLLTSSEPGYFSPRNIHYIAFMQVPCSALRPMQRTGIRHDPHSHRVHSLSTRWRWAGIDSNTRQTDLISVT